MNRLKLCLVQDRFHVGAIAANAAKVIDLAAQAIDEYEAELVLFPELCLTGYAPEDLLLRPELMQRVEQALLSICQAQLPALLLVGCPQWDQGRLYNSLVLIEHGQIQGHYHKQSLPNYQVFDEKRYFSAGTEPLVIERAGYRLGFLICEDVWQSQRVAEAKAAGAEAILVANASPWYLGREQMRLAQLQDMASQQQVAIVYCNLLGGQDELVFDGSSFVVNAEGELVALAAFGEASLLPVEFNPEEVTGAQEHWPEEALAATWQMLCMGLADYVNRNGFAGIVLGLSGGIDSALSLAIAVDALGAERCRAVMMPFEYTSDMSKADAAEQAEWLGVELWQLPIGEGFAAAHASLEPLLGPASAGDMTAQNLQARLRGLYLMALSNRHNLMVLTTGNKSEMAVGYATLYGDMCGGFNVLKDVLKTQVKALAEWRNSLGLVVPERVISRPPSAELAPDQKDEDSLPSYDILDAIIDGHVVNNLGTQALVASGLPPAAVAQVLALIQRSEYKRQQAALGVRISRRAFGKDWRMPVCSGWDPDLSQG